MKKQQQKLRHNYIQLSSYCTDCPSICSTFPLAESRIISTTAQTGPHPLHYSFHGPQYPDTPTRISLAIEGKSYATCFLVPNLYIIGRFLPSSISILFLTAPSLSRHLLIPCSLNISIPSNPCTSTADSHIFCFHFSTKTGPICKTHLLPLLTPRATIQYVIETSLIVVDFVHSIPVPPRRIRSNIHNLQHLIRALAYRIRDAVFNKIQARL